MLTFNCTGAAPPPRPIPTELEILLECLLSGVPAPMATSTPQTGITGMGTLLQCLLPGTPVPAPLSRPGPARRDWTTIVCFSCGKPGHKLGRFPELDETYETSPVHVVGIISRKGGRQLHNNFATRRSRMPLCGKPRLTWGGGGGRGQQLGSVINFDNRSKTFASPVDTYDGGGGFEEHVLFPCHRGLLIGRCLDCLAAG